MKRTLFAFVLALPAFAHHSFNAEYSADKKQTVNGTLVQFLFRNPHSFLQVDAPDDKGKIVRWTVEWAGGGQLGHEGVTRDSLKPGDRVVIFGNLGRHPEDHRLRMIGIRRPSDGFRWGGAFN